jgi:uncharacterized protein (TIGR03790 family)
MIVAIILSLVGLLAPSAFALQADELLLIVNKNQPEGLELAKFYTTARQVPEGHILELDLPRADDISFDDYETNVVPVVRAFLRERGLHNRVRCLVTFYGVPLRISGKTSTDAERAEVAAIKQQLDAVRKDVPPIVQRLESLAKDVNPSFAVEGGEDLNDLGRRADGAMRTIGSGLRSISPQQKQIEILAKLGRIVLEFTGPTKLADMFQGPLPPGLDAPGKDPRWRESAERVKAKVDALAERRFDPAARAELRDAIGNGFGKFGQAHLLQAQVDYLETDGTAAAFDSELALLWWSFYPRSKWQLNPLHYKAKGIRTNPVLMTMRLDAPREDLVREMILKSYKAERDGLTGKIVIDSRGIEAKPNDGYGAYDQTLRNLRNIISERTKMRMYFDDRAGLIPQHGALDVAIYVGWYQLRQYMPSCGFNPGAVGFHIASLEMVSLRGKDETGWVQGLLRSNVSATIGAVAEPYLSAFPPADDYFPLLLTGKLTLAEVYWRTNPMTSWMMNAIGDPLYTPYKVNPQMKVEDLPPRLKDALEPMPRVPLPTTRPNGTPATGPTTRP